MVNQKDVDEIRERILALMRNHDELSKKIGTVQTTTTKSQQEATEKAIDSVSVVLSGKVEEEEETSIELGSAKGFKQNCSTTPPVDEGNHRSSLKSSFSLVDETTSAEEMLKYKVDSTFLDYQEGKPFNSGHNFLKIVEDFHSKRVEDDEIKDFNVLYLVFIEEFRKFGVRQVVFHGNLTSIPWYLINSIGLYFFTYMTGITSVGVVLPSLSLARTLFDPGKELVGSRMCLGCVKSSSNLRPQILTSCLFILNELISMDNYDRKCVLEPDIKLGYQIELWFKQGSVFLLAKDSVSCDDSQQFTKMLPNENTTSCVMLHGRMRMVEVNRAYEIFTQILHMWEELFTWRQKCWLLDGKAVYALGSLLMLKLVCWKRNFAAHYDAQFQCTLVGIHEQGWVVNDSAPCSFLKEVLASTFLMFNHVRCGIREEMDYSWKEILTKIIRIQHQLMENYISKVLLWVIFLRWESTSLAISSWSVGNEKVVRMVRFREMFNRVARNGEARESFSKMMQQGILRCLKLFTYQMTRPIATKKMHELLARMLAINISSALLFLGWKVIILKEIRLLVFLPECEFNSFFFDLRSPGNVCGLIHICKSSEECSYLSLDFAGRVFDQGRLFESGRSCPYFASYSSNLHTGILTSCVPVLNGIIGVVSRFENAGLKYSSLVTKMCTPMKLKGKLSKAGNEPYWCDYCGEEFQSSRRWNSLYRPKKGHSSAKLFVRMMGINFEPTVIRIPGMPRLMVFLRRELQLGSTGLWCVRTKVEYVWGKILQSEVAALRMKMHKFTEAFVSVSGAASQQGFVYTFVRAISVMELIRPTKFCKVLKSLILEDKKDLVGWAVQLWTIHYQRWESVVLNEKRALGTDSWLFDIKVELKQQVLIPKILLEMILGTSSSSSVGNAGHECAQSFGGDGNYLFLQLKGDVYVKGILYELFRRMFKEDADSFIQLGQKVLKCSWIMVTQLSTLLEVMRSLYEVDYIIPCSQLWHVTLGILQKLLDTRGNFTPKTTRSDIIQVSISMLKLRVVRVILVTTLHGLFIYFLNIFKHLKALTGGKSEKLELHDISSEKVFSKIVRHEKFPVLEVGVCWLLQPRQLAIYRDEARNIHVHNSTGHEVIFPKIQDSSSSPYQAVTCADNGFILLGKINTGGLVLSAVWKEETQPSLMLNFCMRETDCVCALMLQRAKGDILDLFGAQGKATTIIDFISPTHDIFGSSILEVKDELKEWVFVMNVKGLSWLRGNGRLEILSRCSGVRYLVCYVGFVSAIRACCTCAFLSFPFSLLSL